MILLDTEIQSFNEFPKYVNIWILKSHMQLLLGIHNGAAALENCLAVPQKVKQNYHRSQQFQPWVYSQEK